MAPHSHDRTLGIGVEVTGKADRVVNVVVAPIGVRAAHTEEYHAEAGLLHDLDRFLDRLLIDTGYLVGDVIALSTGPECIEES